MKAIKNRRNLYAALSVAVIILTVLLLVTEKTEAATLSSEATGVALSNGVSIELGDYVLDGEAEFAVAKLPVEENKDEGYKIEAYDSQEELHKIH